MNINHAEMEKGIKNTIVVSVAEGDTARVLRSGTLDVWGTPAMAALIEETAWKSVAPYLNEGQSTVGSKLDICHLSPSPGGMNVRCETVLVEIDGRRLSFKAEVYDEAGLVGTASHERFIIDSERFMAKAEGKMAAQ